MNGPDLRGDDEWMKRATTSFPVPDSPCRHVVTSVAATRAARSMTSDHAWDVPTRRNAERGSRPDMKLFASSVALITASKTHTAQVRLEASHMLPPSRSVNEFVGARGTLRRKEMFETTDVAILSRCDERFQETLFIGRTRARRPATRDVLPRAGDDLPCVSLCKSKDVSNVAVRVVERLPEDVGGSFSGRQPFQEHPNATGQGLFSLRGDPRIAARVHWFRLAGPDAQFPSCARRLEDVDRQSGRRRREECAGVTDSGAIGHLPT